MSYYFIFPKHNCRNDDVSISIQILHSRMSCYHPTNKIPILSGPKYPLSRRLPILAKLFTVACFTNVSFSSQATAVSTDMITEHPRDIFNSHRLHPSILLIS